MNQSISLHCEFDLHGEPLYSVKWYKDNVEFYRYLPRDTPPSLSFPVPGDHINNIINIINIIYHILGTEVVLSSSDHVSVFLTNISLQTSGLYQCEVSLLSIF